MSDKMNKKLLAEAFDAIVNDNDAAKAHRLFQRFWNISAKSSYALLEAADEDFEITDMGDDFNNEMADEIGSDADEKFNQAQIAVDELEDKFPEEVTDDIRAKFDEVRNILDEMKLAEEGEDDGLAEDAQAALEDLRGEFEMAGELSPEASDLFDEITATITGGEAELDASEDVADDDLSEEDFGDEAESDDGMLDESDGEEIEDEFTIEDEESSEEPLDDMSDEDLESDGEESYDEVQRGEDEVIDEIKYTAEDLAALIDELEGIEGDEKEAVEESFTKVSDPRKKMTSEGEGVNKKGTMNFGKLSGLKIDKKAGLGTSSSNSKGTAPSAKAKMCSTENKGAKSWKKTEKPANKPASAKSVMGN